MQGKGQVVRMEWVMEVVARGCMGSGQAIHTEG